MSKKRIIIGVIVAFVVGVWVYATFIAPKNAPVSEEKIFSEAQKELILERVGKHVVLPHEDPTIGIIGARDVELLRASHPFYARAKAGDVLLLYPSVSQAILFDPNRDEILEMGPIVFENPEGGPEGTY